MEDGTIIELYFARDQRAIRETDTKYGGMCHRLAYRILGERRDAEECVSDTWLGAWNAIPPQRPDPLGAFLCRITRNLALKRYRDSRAAKRDSACTVALEELEGVLVGPDTTQSALEAGELTRLLEQFLDGLTPEDRAIFLGRYWFAAPYADIATKVGLSEKNVSVRLTRLRKRLKDFLTESGVNV